MGLSAALGDADALAELEAPGDQDVRWAVHRTMWQVSPLKKVRACRRYAFDHDGGTVPLRGTQRPDGGLDVGFGNLKTCSCWHSCLVCSVIVAVKRAQELAHALRIWDALGGTVMVATLTARHHKGQSLAEVVGGLRAGREAVVSARPWKRDRERLGIRFLIWAFEATYGDRTGWHAHYHCYLFCDTRWVHQEERIAYVDKRGRPRSKRVREWWAPPWDVPGADTSPMPLPDELVARDLLRPMWERWRAGLATVGMSAVAEVVRDGEWETAGFDVAVMNLTEGSTGLASYPFKLALEAVGAVFKRGGRHDREGREPGKRHRTPFEVMEAYAVARGEGDIDGAEDDRRIITEWSLTANDMRFRQAPWPPGMRAWFAEQAARLGIEGPLLEAEQTDEEVVDAAEMGGETLADVPEDAYSSVVVWELDTLRAVARAGGWQAVMLWFDVRGIPIEPREHSLGMVGEAVGGTLPGDEVALADVRSVVDRRRDLLGRPA